MSKRNELQQKLTDLMDSLDAVPEEFKADIQAEIDATQAELDALKEDNPAPAPAPAPAPYLY